MNHKQKYKNQITAIKEVLQKHDPLNYLVPYADERFEKQLYSYEAATILEKFHNSSPNNSDIEAYIVSCSKSGNKTSSEAIKNSASDVNRIILSKDKSSENKYCKKCGFIGEPIKKPRGSVWFAIVLLVLFFPVALVYILTNRGFYYTCKQCGNIIKGEAPFKI